MLAHALMAFTLASPPGTPAPACTLAGPPVEARWSGTIPPASRADPLLRVVADVPLPGSASRFDYQSLESTTGRLFISHMGAGQLVVFDVRAGRVVANLAWFPTVTGVLAVPAEHRAYASATGDHAVVVVDDSTFQIVTFRENQWRRLKTAGSHRVVPLWPQLEQILRPYVFGDRPPARLLFPSFRTGAETMLTDFRKLLDAVAVRAGWRVSSRPRYSGTRMRARGCRRWIRALGHGAASREGGGVSRAAAQEGLEGAARSPASRGREALSLALFVALFGSAMKHCAVSCCCTTARP